MKRTLILLTVSAAIFFNSCGNKAADSEKMANDTASKQNTADSLNKLAAIYVHDSLEDASIKGYTIKQLQSDPSDPTRMELEYSSLAQLISQAKADAKSKMWTEDELATKLKIYRDSKAGGEVTISLYSGVIDLADIGNQTLIVKDTADKELFRKTFASSTPTVVGTEFLGIGIASLPQRIAAPFYIYVVTNISKVPRKYIVKPNLK
jgi:hypothetical protein